MVNRKWAYRALFDSEAEAARAYDAALWRLKPKEAVSFVNFKDGISVRVAKRPPRLTSTLERSKYVWLMVLESTAFQYQN